MAEKDEDFTEQMGSFEDSNVSYLRFLEARGAKGLRTSPTSSDAFQVQADYLKELGDQQHPFDVLRRISLNPWVNPGQRIAACKALLEYTAAKMPSKVEVSGAEGQPIKIDNGALKNLSTGELDQLIRLLDKANGVE